MSSVSRCPCCLRVGLTGADHDQRFGDPLRNELVLAWGMGPIPLGDRALAIDALAVPGLLPRQVLSEYMGLGAIHRKTLVALPTMPMGAVGAVQLHPRVSVPSRALNGCLANSWHCRRSLTPCSEPHELYRSEPSFSPLRCDGGVGARGSRASRAGCARKAQSGRGSSAAPCSAGDRHIRSS